MEFLLFFFYFFMKLQKNKKQKNNHIEFVFVCFVAFLAYLKTKCKSDPYKCFCDPQMGPDPVFGKQCFRAS